jgi:signal transduction histidine kinase
VVADPDQRPGYDEGQADKNNRNFAAFIRTNHDAILASYLECLEKSHSPITGDGYFRDQLTTNGSEIIADMAASVRAGRVVVDDRYMRLAWTIGEAHARSQLSIADTLCAARTFFNVTFTSLARHVSAHPELLPSFVMSVLALNESLNSRLCQFTVAYTSYLLDRVDKAHLDERCRIARELHDQLGEGLSAALRQLELHEIAGTERRISPDQRTAVVRGSIVETMDRLRAVLSDLRQDPVTSLEKALTDYIESRTADPHVRLLISGDETQAPPSVINETYLIMREAIRNALAHGAPELVLIEIDFAAYELRASVDDDGCGFAPAERSGPSAAGLTSMRERAILIGGRLTIASTPGQGTRVELVVPLPGQRDERAG